MKMHLNQYLINIEENTKIDLIPLEGLNIFDICIKLHNMNIFLKKSQQVKYMVHM